MYPDRVTLLETPHGRMRADTTPILMGSGSKPSWREPYRSSEVGPGGCQLCSTHGAS
jgi:hypothetical protein